MNKRYTIVTFLFVCQIISASQNLIINVKDQLISKEQTEIIANASPSITPALSVKSYIPYNKTIEYLKQVTKLIQEKKLPLNIELMNIESDIEQTDYLERTAAGLTMNNQAILLQHFMTAVNKGIISNQDIGNGVNFEDVSNADMLKLLKLFKTYSKNDYYISNKNEKILFEVKGDSIVVACADGSRIELPLNNSVSDLNKRIGNIFCSNENYLTNHKQDDRANNFITTTDSKTDNLLKKAISSPSMLGSLSIDQATYNEVEDDAYSCGCILM